MNKPLEFVICRGYPGHKCEVEYAKWSHPFCRRCWKGYYKHRGYIPTREEDEKYCTK